MAADERARIPQRPAFPAIDELDPKIAAPGRHYVVDIAIVDPVVDAEAWRLEVDGLVGRPLLLGADELRRRFPVVEEHSVLTCISNPVGGPLVGSSKWTGVRLRDVLAAAEPRAGATQIVFESADGYTVTVPLGMATEPHALLALGHGGLPLRPEHGAPCRVRLPALYGMMNAKWLDRIPLVDGRRPGYWAWTQWALAWRPPKTGNYAIMCRATDGDRRLQGAAPRPPHPSGASGLHRIELRAT